MTLSRLEAVLRERKRWVNICRPDPILPEDDFGV
jgi:hypothetical protein